VLVVTWTVITGSTEEEVRSTLALLVEVRTRAVMAAAITEDDTPVVQSILWSTGVAVAATMAAARDTKIMVSFMVTCAVQWNMKPDSKSEQESELYLERE
jgi:hypothetical protein